MRRHYLAFIDPKYRVSFTKEGKKIVYERNTGREDALHEGVHEIGGNGVLYISPPQESSST